MFCREGTSVFHWHGREHRVEQKGGWKDVTLDQPKNSRGERLIKGLHLLKFQDAGSEFRNTYLFKCTMMSSPRNESSRSHLLSCGDR